jgi:ATP-dependent exoDNAse (exonuclease V) beta subunit
LEQLEVFIQRFLERKEEQRVLRFKDKLNRVKLSNVHKVKGLQAPIVILAKPSAPERGGDHYVDYTLAVPEARYAQFAWQDGAVTKTIVKTEQFDALMPDWQAREKAERERIEYVAATRAESVLVVSDGPVNSNQYNPWADLYRLADGGYDNGNFDIDSRVSNDVPVVDVPLGEPGSNEESHKQTREYRSPSQIRTCRANNNLDEIDDAEYSKEENKAAALAGTLVHRLMELIVSSKDRYSIDDALKVLYDEHGSVVKDYDGILRHIAYVIHFGGFSQKNSSVDQDILKTLLNAKQVWCETPFSYQSKEGNVIHGIIDLIYQGEDGKYHIIDYKTNEEDDVSALEETYKEQLFDYRCALRKNGIDADTHIYHIPLH